MEIVLKILHTSDWHIGRTLDGNDLAAEQADVLEQILGFATTYRPDVVVVAGDVYDLPSPSAASQQLCNQYIIKLGQVAPVLIIPGNHDSRNRFKALEEFAEASNIHITSQIHEVTQRAFQFEENGKKVRVYCIPFVAPNNVRGLEGFEGVSLTHEGVVESLMQRIKKDADVHSSRIIAVSHLFLTGGEQSKSKAERDIEYGGVHDIKASSFSGADLVLLGHLHRSQTPSKKIPVAHYSGSIMRYSFSETNHVKSCSLIEYDPETGDSVIETIDIELPSGMARLQGNSVEDVLENVNYDGHIDDWVEVTLPWSQRGTNPLVRLKQKFPKAASIKFIKIVSSDEELSIGEAKEGESIADQATTFFENVAGEGEATESRLTIVTNADEQARGE